MKLKKIITIILCLCILGSLACAFADNVKEPQGKQPPQMDSSNGGRPPEMDTGDKNPGDILGSWNKLLENGIIDEDTLKAVEEYLMSKMSEHGEIPEIPAGGKMPQMPGSGQNMTHPDGTENNGQPPEGFDKDAQPPEKTEGEEQAGYPGITSELLNELYENEILDDNTYLVLVELIDTSEEQ